MPRFRVDLVRTVVEWREVTLEAATLEEALERAGADPYAYPGNEGDTGGQWSVQDGEEVVEQTGCGSCGAVGCCAHKPVCAYSGDVCDVCPAEKPRLLVRGDGAAQEAT